MKRLLKKPKNGYLQILFKILDYPLDFIRDYTIPPAQDGEWNRLRASVTPATMTLAFMCLWPMVSKEIKARQEDPEK